MNTAREERSRLQRLRPVLECRAALINGIRAFFDAQGFLDVETPIRIPIPAMEQHIDVEPSGSCFLRTSPELHMKRLLAAGYPALYQIGPCFRSGERGDWHNPEYTMLEWYRAGVDYSTILADTRNLLLFLADRLLGKRQLPWQEDKIDLEAPWQEFTVREVFMRHAGWDPVASFDSERFDHDLIFRVEPELSRTSPVILRDYPAPAAALARCKPGQPEIAERWELYLGGIEIANAFSELTDAVEQRARFKEWGEKRRADKRPVYPLDEDFLQALEEGMPPSGGIALGVDRLVMIWTNSGSLDDVLPFRP